MNLSNNILNEWIKSRQFSYMDFARLLKISPTTVHQWVHGYAVPHPRNALKIHKVTKGEVPFWAWGYVMTKRGKLEKISDHPLTSSEASRRMPKELYAYL